MKRRLTLIAASALALTAFAEEAHDHSAPAAKPPAGSEKVMHSHMKKMREQMAQIRAATDPVERQRLMEEHVKTMEQSMAKMQHMQGCGKM